MTQLTHTTLDPATVRADQGEARWWFDALAVIKVTGAETGGAMTIVEMTYPRDADTPLHVHHREDEAFWILEGGATFLVGEQTIEAGAGDYLFGPRDIPHKFTVGPEGCRMLHPRGQLRERRARHERPCTGPHDPSAVRHAAEPRAHRGCRSRQRLRAADVEIGATGD
jgi:quercetin dioxygenase-like cupin family protein